MRIILHLDMDAFFASVEERDKPRLRGLPIVVGADPAGGKGRGVVSTANYIARAYGIRSAMPISKAWQLSQQAKKAGKPEVVFMGGSFSQYAKVSREIFSKMAEMGDAFEPASVDEAYVDVSSLGSYEAATERAKEIQKYVETEHRLTCSIGIGPNKLIAKIAAGQKKPKGLTVVREEEVQDFLDPMPVRELAGIGPKSEGVLNALGIQTVKELRQKSREFLIENFGKHGESMYRYSRGISDSPVESGTEAKSSGRHYTFDKDTLEGSELMPVLAEMATEIAADVVREKKWFRTVTLTVRFSNFTTMNRSRTIEVPSQDAKTLETEGMKLLLPFLDSRENPKRLKLRLIGLRAEKFVPAPEPGSMKPLSSSGSNGGSTKKQTSLF